MNASDDRSPTVPGGCESCDAYTETLALFTTSDLTVIAVRHDDNCPLLAEIEGRPE